MAGSIGARRREDGVAVWHVLAVWLWLVPAVAGASPEPFVSIQRGTQSAIIEPREVVLESDTEWRALWARHVASAIPPPPADFAREIVVGVFAGQQPTAGYQVEIVSVDREPAEMVVRYRIEGPPSDALVAQTLTQPFHLVRLARLGLPVRFHKL